MKAAKIAFTSQQKLNDQMADFNTEAAADFSIPILITSDTKLLPDYPSVRVDCTSGDVTLTLTDSQTIDNFAWTIQRIDATSNKVFVTGEDPTQLINGQVTWEMFPSEKLTFSGELDKYTVK